jgi:hypothetical protein
VEGSPPVSWDLTKAGWSDAPLDPEAAQEIEQDCFKSLDGDSQRQRRARRALYGFLVYNLDTWGARSVEQMAGELEWFNLHLSDGETKHLVDSARRHGMVKAIGDEKDVYGTSVHPQWIPTERGLRLACPRGASPGDLWVASLKVGDQLRGAFKEWWTLVVLASGLFSIQIARGDTLDGWLFVAAGLIVVAIVLSLGVRGELDLKAMAESWPRLEKYRPARHAWQVHPVRPWLVATEVFLCVAGGVIAAFAVIRGLSWGWLAVAATVAFSVVAWCLYRRVVRGLDHAWLEEQDEVVAYWDLRD